MDSLRPASLATAGPPPRGDPDPARPASGPPRTVVAIDWSGAAKGAERRIWVAVVTDGTITRLEAGHPRIEIPEVLELIAATAGPVVAGLDFAFGLPAWFARELGCTTGPTMWERARTDGEGWLHACAPPFWGRPGKRRPHADPSRGLRDTDRRARQVGSSRPKSPFQIGGAGAVGTGSIRGMPVLADLRARGFAIWPFDPPRWPLAIEIYPRHFTGPVVKSNPHARVAHLQRALPGLPTWVIDAVRRSDDAFDAATASLGMWAARAALASLPVIDDEVARIEGRIWDPEPLPDHGQ